MPQLEVRRAREEDRAAVLAFAARHGNGETISNMSGTNGCMTHKARYSSLPWIANR